VTAALDGVTNPNLKAVVQLVSSAPYYQLYYDQYMSPAVGNTVNDQTQGLFAGTATSQAVAQAINTSASSPA
jgi:raffinose/stachyose/melibiose transport system substrate-binding protein